MWPGFKQNRSSSVSKTEMRCLAPSFIHKALNLRMNMSHVKSIFIVAHHGMFPLLSKKEEKTKGMKRPCHPEYGGKKIFEPSKYNV